MNSESVFEFEKLLSTFTPIGLEELEAVSLLERQDTKFAFKIGKLSEIINRISKDYLVLEINNKRLFSYESLYYDTENLFSYLMHHNNRPNRFKVRLRKYLDSQISYFEIKGKNLKGKTVKNRITVAGNFKYGDAESTAFVKQFLNIDPGKLVPTMLITYHRFTLADKNFNERATFDLNLVCKSFKDGFITEFSSVVIAEVKQVRFNRNSPLVRALQEENIVPLSFSKYCMGVLTCVPNVKYNRFKKNLIRLNKVTGQHINRYAENGNF